MRAFVTPKVHQFFPFGENKTFNIRKPLFGSPNTIPEYKTLVLNTVNPTYQFPIDNYPKSIYDLFIVKNGLVLRNRISMVNLTREVADFERETFTYNPIDRTITFHVIPTGPITLCWTDLKVMTPRNETEWQLLDFKQHHVQGANYIDEDLIPPNETNLTGKFQGGFKTFIEVVSLPIIGALRYADNDKGLLYRGSAAFIGMDSFQYRLYNILGQESDTACIFVNY